MKPLFIISSDIDRFRHAGGAERMRSAPWSGKIGGHLSTGPETLRIA